ncbi:MAG: multiheme c-type cytochrome, partial [Calditrichaceae bacterium]
MKYLILIFIMFLFSNVFSQGYKLESADDCAACHQDIFKQWQGSMHAKSTLDSDPLYRAMFEWASEDTKGKITLKCKNCHMPYYNLNDSLIDNNVIRERPVDCLYCHSVEDIHKAPVFSDIKYSAA